MLICLCTTGMWKTLFSFSLKCWEKCWNWKIRKCWNVKSSPSVWCVCATHYQSASPGRVCHILSLITFWKLRNRNWEETIHWNFKQSVWRSGFIGDSFMIVGDGDGCMLWCRMLWWEIQLYKLKFKQNVFFDFSSKEYFSVIKRKL